MIKTIVTHSNSDRDATTSTKLGMVFSTNNNEDDDDDDFANFNPFDKKQKGFMFSNSQISPRQMQMQELMADLLRKVDDDDMIEDLLQKKKSFLLQPLLDGDSFFYEKDSIYTPEMTQDERFEKYNTVMEERMKSAQNKAVLKILTSLTNFVMSHR